ncbi:uroporphyrinogen decarboxylase family protein [Crassaminicella profunda]|uniref:uroporphyrinogen decarboxylase family protein n=1 Tax=Crassaminicella profunda TaxID=1286698 RepID=UPI001CA64D5A|nr:uroporphyrinogen decarboxylase family protein [Crassaminicella profunda]QZY54205.1 uroporphyrinogen decarboxylase family protein [Crassaminicella profunda]
MTGKERIIKLLKKEKVDKVPWVPFAGVHAGKLKGYTAKEILQDKDKLVEALLEVKKLYQPDGMPVVFDLQMEAEVLGCDLLWAENNPPSVRTHPLAETKDIPCTCMVPSENDGRIPMILEAMREIREKIGEDTALYGLITGPFTLASHLRGVNIFMDMIEDPEYTKKLLAYTTEVANAMSKYFIEAGMDVIAVVDPLVSQISPRHFKKLLHEPFKVVFDFIRENGALSSFFVCGDATKNIEPMCKTNPDSISVDENVDMVVAKEVTDQYDVVIGGNIPLTTVMLHGTQQDNMKYVVDLLDQLTHERLIIAPGCDMPYDLPIENTIAVQQAVRQTEEIREILKNYTAVEQDIEIEIPDYKNLKKPFIEVFTLDSVACAACTYMLGAAMDAKEYFGDAIDVIEYKYTEKESIARCKAMGVTNLPSIYINGKVEYKSIIPSRQELFAKIEEAKKELA